MGYSLGIDIGITSVGWGIINDQGNVINAGVRLFKEATNDENIGRREKRGMRRRIRRKRHRLDRLNKLLIQKGFINKDFDYYQSKDMVPYQIRAKGLSQQLTKVEIAIALYHLLKRRGLHTLDGISEKEEVKEGTESTKDIIASSREQLQNQFVCELQLQRFEKSGQVRGTKNRYLTEDYEKEARKLLEVQREFYNEIDDEFIDKYIMLLIKRREYFEGPGNGSPYGWNSIEEWMDKLVGRCTYFPGEKRLVKRAPTAEIFNLLNDLNNLNVSGEKLDLCVKKQLIEELFKKQKSVSGKALAKKLGVSIEELSGYRKNKKEEPVFTELLGFHAFSKINKEMGNLIPLDDLDYLDQVAIILTYYQAKTHAKKHLIEDLNMQEMLADRISNILEEKTNPFKGTHSLSKKAIMLIWDDLWETSYNQMELFTQHAIIPRNLKVRNTREIDTKGIVDWIVNPVAKRAIVQSIKTINKIVENYGEPNSITIEMAREKNSDDKKTWIKNSQKKSEAINKQVIDLIQNNNVSMRLFQMIKLYILQDGKSMYSLKDIELDELLFHSERFEVDHIIPKSISFDDSLNNKVLVYWEENQDKGNRTPYYYLSSKGRYDFYKAYVLSVKDKQKMSRKKREYLLFEEDITKWKVQKEFINRNLADTRYATREVLTLLRYYFKEKNSKVKIQAINGSFTNYLRKLWGIPKDRDEDYSHHAVDALLISISNHVLSNLDNFQKYQLQIIGGEEVGIYMQTGEIIDNKMFDEKIRTYLFAAKNIRSYRNFKYSHMVDRKPNRKFTNETLYSTRNYDGTDYIINKITNIYNKNNKKIREYFSNQSKYEKLLVFRNDPKTFEILMRVYEEYKDNSAKDNPLYFYYEEFGAIRKYTKKKEGAPIYCLKYIKNKLGNSYMDLSDKYKINSNKKVVMLTQNGYRMDVYSDGNCFKFVSVLHSMLKDKGEYYLINEEEYYNALICKKINDQHKFMFSLYKGDVFILDKKKYIFVGVNEDAINRIEFDWVNKSYRSYAEKENIGNKQLRKPIGKSVEEFVKLNVDIIGNEFMVKNEILKMKISK